ncbi:DUF4159 domain-containing protein [Xanthobacteraceae bacterium Astr-EGSB]|uniref:DUF4159 domain-containing protein n=1 Tax=Astrobacterium formosum TaxID=3069710 RepID=UPI0027B0101A|nr:DUF4159 domain-containing protein [Xanthobacteraceae bacterium Astr-EGSB]
MGGLPLGFAQPLVLLGLLSLPVLWWLLRLVPPRPRRIQFPPTRLLFDIAPKEETPARTPWWLTLLRLTLAALVILAAAGPSWNPPVATAQANVPIALLVDDGWAAASTWDARMRTAEDVVARAEADRRGIALVPLSDVGRDISLETPGAVRVRLRQLTPRPHTIERADILPAFSRFLQASPGVEIIWLSDGIDLGGGDEFVAALARLAERRSVTVISGGLAGARALAAADNAAGFLTVKVLRADNTAAADGIVRAFDLRGAPLADTRFAFRGDERETEAQFDLPVEIRNDIARLEIFAERSAGAVQLLDKRWRRRTIGVITGTTSDTAQPLLAATYYLGRALGPFADVRFAERGSPADAVGNFVEQRVPMMILADVGNVAGEARNRLNKWVEDGGVLVRFAGPRLAAGDDELVPVKLRRGGRILGGSLSWEKPQPLAGFSRESPFAGMPVPNDVTVMRQVLAEPDTGLSERTWATLADGTPLVTGARRGKGMIVLFHVTADTRWSDLPLSGAFVEMLKRIVALSGTINVDETAQSNASRDVLPASRVLNGFGQFEAPPPTARPVLAGYAGRAKADNPPGFYGPPEGLQAINTLVPDDRLARLDFSALSARIEPYRQGEPQDLRGAVFLAALALLLIDALVVFWLAGGIHRLVPRRRAGTAIVLIAAAALLAGQSDASAQAPASPPPAAPPPAAARPAAPPDPRADDFAVKATLDTRLAYVVTGNAEADSVSRAGLQGLTLFLAQRTALEAGDPIGLDLSRDELAFFPLIYWPVVPEAPRPSPQTLAKVDAYMKRGGTVLFDTRDAVVAPAGVGGETRSPGMVALRSILSSLDLPELEPVPKDHVLTKTFFLLRDFPGRFNGGQLWVEALVPADELENEDESGRPARGGDGVSSIIITSNDLAGAWASRPDGQPMLPMGPGDARQREMAYRAGVNIVMYTLTGNYKADQVHIPALLERLGQ